jgi:hypothetical protein
MVRGSLSSFTEEASSAIQNEHWSANQCTELVKQTQHVAVNAPFNETEAWYALRTVTEQCDPFDVVLLETAQTFLDAATEQCDSFKAMLFAIAQNEIDDAFDAATQGIDCNPITAQSLKDRYATFDTSVATARKVLIKDLMSSSPDSDQSVLQNFDASVSAYKNNLQEKITTNVSASFDTDKVTLLALRDDSPIEDLTAQVPMAFALKTRAEALSEFLNEGLLDAVNDITDAHFARTLTAAEDIANLALAAAQTTAETMTGTQPTTETPAQLTARMTGFDTAAREALAAFDTAVGGILDNPEGQNKRAALGRSIELRAASTSANLKAAVSRPLETICQAVQETTLAELTKKATDVNQLKARRQELGQPGSDWLTEGLATQIDSTVAAYAKKVEQEKSATTIRRIEMAAQAQLLTKISHVAEATKIGTTSSLINMGELWQNLESEFRDPNKGPGWKYTVSLDTAFDEILKGKKPKNTTEYVRFLRAAMDRLNAQAGIAGLPEPYQRSAETALQRLESRNEGSPRLCAWAMSANLRLVMSVIETFGDTRAAQVSAKMQMGIGSSQPPNNIALHEGITLKQKDEKSLTGYSREHGALWSTLHSRPIDFLTIETVAADNIPGRMLSVENIATLIEKMATGSILKIEDYVPAAGGQEAMLTQDGWKSFCAVLGADATMSAFLEARWPVSADPIPLSELSRRLDDLLKNEAAYKHLRYLFGRKLEWAYQELVL